MNELQWALLVASVIAVGGVWMFNLWQERKHRQATERLFASSEDALVSERATASADRSSLDSPNGNDQAQWADDEFFIAPTPDESKDTLTPVPSFAQWADAMSDCLVHFDVPEALSASVVMEAKKSWRGALGKSLRFLGRTNATDAWSRIEDDDTGRYTHWLGALQLADRNGALSDQELEAFLDGMEQFGIQINTPIVMPDRAEMLLKAQKLDEFCASVDIQFSFHLVESHGGAFVGTKLRGVCEAVGLGLRPDGTFHSVNLFGATEYRLKNSGEELLTVESLRSMTTPNVMLILDSPLVADGVAAFDRLVGTSRQLERGLGGKLVDAQGNEVGDPLIHGIRSKIGDLQKLMVDAGIEPGGVLATRLFS
jgi:ZipA, C-terminal FtsZ-binding domain